MPRSAIVLLLLGAVACAYAAEEVKSSPMFDNWMYKRDSTKVHSASYKDIDTEHVCLYPKPRENCRTWACTDVCKAPYYQTPVACCGHPVREGPLDFWVDRPTIGKCQWEEKLFNEPITSTQGQATMSHMGKFTVECDMNDDSDKCSDALCDGMKLVGYGDIMEYSRVAFVGLDANADAPTCDAPVPVPVPASRIAPAKTPAKIQYAHEEEHRRSYYLGTGRIFIGGFKVVSHQQPAKYQAGKIQLAYPAGLLREENELPAQYWVTKNNRIELEFVKSEAH